MLLGFIGLNLILSTLLGFVLFQVSNNIYYKSFLNHKKSLGISIANSIDATKYQTFYNKKSIGDPEFKRYLEFIRSVAKNEKFITWIYTLGYDEKNDRLIYAIDASPSDVEAIWIGSEFLGIKTFINNRNNISISYDSIEYEEKLEINFKNKKFHIEIDQNNKEIYINKEKVLSIIQSNPLAGVTNLCLSLAAFTSNRSKENIKLALEKTTVKDIKNWTFENIGTSLHQMRRQAFSYT